MGRVRLHFSRRLNYEYLKRVKTVIIGARGDVHSFVLDLVTIHPWERPLAP